ncbi:TRAP transporter TatT component family protein [Salinispirillum sp. LH 10-3-1]|uniref:TRAP transporter TatT component family protein n=1 Tax=Salinispirillum sp. LH 10-3-1 TaxID=2952525 RepID=A0AB38YCN4_9GAMM
MLRILVSIAACLVVTGCATTRLPGNIADGILSNTDLEVVGDGLPTYLITLDGLVNTYPRRVGILATAAELNSAYAGVFVESPERQRHFTAKALDLSMRAACRDIRALCNPRQQTVIELEENLANINRTRHAESLYLLGSTWASYIQTHSDDWNAVAELAKVQRILERQVLLDPSYSNGMGQLYLGVLASLLPPALGGQPEIARTYFESAIEQSEGRNLIVKVYYAQQYARLLFDQELHDRLLKEVLAADPRAGTLTLQNTYAQQLAAELLESGQYYF